MIRTNYTSKIATTTTNANITTTTTTTTTTTPTTTLKTDLQCTPWNN